ncbi:MAG: acylphosphatase [Ignavibacteriales bacterium]|nr:acylphosphatase [Ignavibacteriales bacterium]
MRRAEIIANGLVQGVGFRYFVVREAQALGLKGYVKNLYSGEVLTVVEGEKYMVEELYNKIKIGTSFADVKNASIKWSESKNEFTKFEIRF